MVMKTMPAAKFKEQCLSVLDRVGPEGLVITKRGKPVARLLPFASSHGLLLGVLRDKLRVRGDVFSTGARWDAADD